MVHKSLKPAFDASQLAQFTGSDEFYRHQLTKAVYTQGVQYVAETAGAYWLIDEIAILASHEKALKGVDFQVWELKVRDDDSATLTCEDGNDNAVYSKEIGFTDFPAPGVKVWFVDGTLLLPSEY